MRLLLFDIDGTLLRVREGAKEAIEQAVATVTGRAASTEPVSFSGRTDLSIFRDVLRTNDLPPNDALLDEIVREYVGLARETIRASQVDRLPGAGALLSMLSDRDDVYLGLVTGNAKAVARHKLATVKLACHFSVGAFGNDHHERDRLPDLAVRRASAAANYSFSAPDAIVIGDTPRDISCARTAGALSVAVSTGRPSYSTLASHSPDLLFETLAHPEEVARQILRL